MLAGVAAGLTAAFFAFLYGAFQACEGSPSYGNGGVSDSWVCREPYRPVIGVLEVVFGAVALLGPIVGAAAGVGRSQARWVIVGAAVGGLALLLQILVNEGQVAVLS